MNVVKEIWGWVELVGEIWGVNESKQTAFYICIILSKDEYNE